MKDQFYIGYLEKMPERNKKPIRNVLILIGLGMLAMAVLFVTTQKVFEPGTYELGRLSEIEGVIVEKPFLHVRLTGQAHAGTNLISQSLPLMSFGKFGAEEDIEKIKERIKTESGKNLDQVIVKLNGTLDYRDGKSLFELSKKEESLVSYKEAPANMIAGLKAQTESLGPITMQGQIMDSKCFFGTMKPGRGKPHRACASLCISGGIPPLFFNTNAQGESIHCLLRDENGGMINQEVLPYVAEPVEISGELFRYDDWLVMEVNASGIKRL